MTGHTAGRLNFPMLRRARRIAFVAAAVLVFAISDSIWIALDAGLAADVAVKLAVALTYLKRGFEDGAWLPREFSASGFHDHRR